MCLRQERESKKANKLCVQNAINDYDKTMTNLHKEVNCSRIDLQPAKEVAVQNVPRTKLVRT